NFSNASRPPADAPRPTTGNFSVLRRSSTSGNGRNGVSDSMPHCAPTRGTADCSPRGGTTAAHTPDNDMDHPVRDLVVVGAWAGPRVIGVLLSGRNDDGTAGMQAIQACGGITIVQDPLDAEEPAMPRSALDHVMVDHCVPANRLGALLRDLAGQPVPNGATVS